MLENSGLRLITARRYVCLLDLKSDISVIDEYIEFLELATSFLALMDSSDYWETRSGDKDCTEVLSLFIVPYSKGTLLHLCNAPWMGQSRPEEYL